MFPSTGLTALLTLGLLAKCLVAAPAPTPRASISWGSCESFGVNATVTNLECAYLDVPMDYHDSSAGNARLAVIKLAATANKLGTVFFNPGGPGGSGLQAVSGLAELFIQDLQGAFDVISWDPRGVGHTFPGETYCFNSTEEVTAFWQHTPIGGINETISGKFNERDTQELYSKVDLTEQKVKDFTARCQSGSAGPYLKYVGTSSTIRDLVSLGDAIVGEGKPINYWGVSYGTVIGFNFVNMFPERVGNVVLDGVVDPIKWTTEELLTYGLADVEKSYSGLTDGCAKAGRAGCKLIEITGDNATGEDVKALLNYALDLYLKLYRDGYGLPFPPNDLKNGLFVILYIPMWWSEIVNKDVYQVVALTLQTARAHNVTIPGGNKYNVPSGNITIDADPISMNLTSYSTAAITGADNFRDNVGVKDIFDTIVEITRDTTPTFGTILPNVYLSSMWPVRSVERLPAYSPKELRNPVLVIGNSADPITPFASAKKAADMLGDNAFLIEQLGFGHASIAQVSSCTIGAMYSYLVNATLPEGKGTQCSIDNPDLFPVLNGTTTATRRSNLLRRWL